MLSRVYISWDTQKLKVHLEIYTESFCTPHKWESDRAIYFIPTGRHRSFDLCASYIGCLWWWLLALIALVQGGWQGGSWLGSVVRFSIFESLSQLTVKTDNERRKSEAGRGINKCHSYMRYTWMHLCLRVGWLVYFFVLTFWYLLH